MADILYITQYDLQPYYYVTAQDQAGTAINLTGASIVCTMRNRRTREIVIDRQSAGISITGASTGQFEYRWQAGDTDLVGDYHIEFELTPTTGGKFTLPSRAHEAEVSIRESLDSQ